MQIAPLGVNFALFLYEANVDPYPPPIEQSFKGYNSPLKKAFRKGALGDKVYGIYGERLTQDTISLEHIQPIAHGGKTTLSNLLLADKKKNNERGTKPIGEFVTIGMLRDYLKQFKDVKTSYFDGNKYIKLIRETFRKIVDE